LWVEGVGKERECGAYTKELLRDIMPLRRMVSEICKVRLEAGMTYMIKQSIARDRPMIH
jgi:hypothetical protein